MKKRVFWLVMDSVGTGEMPDAARYGDEGSNTLRSVSRSPFFQIPYLLRLGLANIDQCGWGQPAADPQACFGRLGECSAGKDTTTGHWEMAGLISPTPLPTFPQGFPQELIQEFSREIGRGVLCNKPYSGTQVIRDYGQEHLQTGKVIVYTSADSVFQIAAHEERIPVEELYQICQTARRLLVGKWGVGRVIARPFVGRYPNFTRTANRHDFSLPPSGPTVLNLLQQAGLETIGVGKIGDIFAGSGLSRSLRTRSNDDGMEKTLQLAREDFCGLCFVNLVEFDMTYGHRNDPDGYAKALSAFDRQLERLTPLLRKEDLVIVTADHGCDPGTPSTDHSREYVPLLVYGRPARRGVNLGTRMGFCDIGATVADYFFLDHRSIAGHSFLSQILLP